LRSLVIEAARYRLGAYDRESFQGLARDLLLDGRDEGVPLLLLRDVHSERARSVFERVCASVGQAIPSVEDAAMIVITSIAQNLDERRITPRRAIELLGELSGSLPDRLAGDLAVGSGAAVGLAGLLAGATPWAMPGSRPLPPGAAGTAAGQAGGASEQDVRRFAADWLAAHQAMVVEILATRCGMPIDRGWRELAAEKRAGEDRLIARYRHQLFGDGASRAVEKTRMHQTPWGPGAQVASDLFVTAIGRRSAWPETQMVLDVFWSTFPDRPWVMMLGVWPPAEIRDSEPRYNDVLWFNLREWLHSASMPRLHEQPGPVAYYVHGNRYDDHPAALGPEPAELLAARQEDDQMKRAWLKVN
jgi:hypothetical protein